jgi:hypothetical protein
MRYRKKPIEVEAKQCKVIYERGEEVVVVPEGVVKRFLRRGWWIKTLEGWYRVNVGNRHDKMGDWIITGIQGEKYPCKPDIFEQTYERASVRHEEVFVRHIAGHLEAGQQVICKICGKSAKEICAALDKGE